jgi:hypothetical protein
LLYFPQWIYKASSCTDNFKHLNLVMKVVYISVLLTLLIIACSKENTNNGLRSSNITNAVQNDIPIPLNDLGAGTYLDSTGGLYPGGINAPFGTYASDLLTTSQGIVPIDTFGVPGITKVCKITFLSLGGSTGGHNMKLLKTKTTGNPLTNPKLQLLSANNGTGDASMNSIINPNDIYWAHVTQIIAGGKSSYRQVQVIYLETDDSSRNISWPFRPNLIKTDLETGLRNLKQKFPNLKVVYVLGRTRTFGAKALWNREPSPYYFGWGCKWAIEDQMNGAPGTEYKGGNAVAPMLAWGFYQWADSLPRTTDGFYWRSYETADGLHATADGQDTLATHFQNFLLTDQYASIWYAKH